MNTTHCEPLVQATLDFFFFSLSECAPFTVVPSSRGYISGFRASGKPCLFRLWMTIMGKHAHAKRSKRQDVEENRKNRCSFQTLAHVWSRITDNYQLL